MGKVNFSQQIGSWIFGEYPVYILLGLSVCRSCYKRYKSIINYMFCNFLYRYISSFSFFSSNFLALILYTLNIRNYLTLSVCQYLIFMSSLLMNVVILVLFFSPLLPTILQLKVRFLKQTYSFDGEVQNSKNYISIYLF